MKKLVFFALAMALTLNNTSRAQTSYEKSVDVGFLAGMGEYKNNTFSLSMINGYRFSNTLFAGIGVGVGFSNALNGVDISTLDITTEYRTEAILIPVFANIKANLIDESKVSPFLSINVGYTIDANQYLRDAPGFMLQPNFGIDFSLSDKNAIYLLVGFNLQHFEYTYTRNVGTTTTDWDITTKSEMFKSIDIRVGLKF